MPQWFIANMCIRLTPDNFLSPEERYALSYGTDAMKYDAATAIRILRLLEWNEMWSVVRKVVLPTGRPFMVVRGYAPNPIPLMDEDDPAPDLCRIHTVPVSIVAVYGRVRADDTLMTILVTDLKSRYPGCGVSRYTRFVRCSPAEFDAVTVVSVLDEHLVHTLSTTIATCDVFPLLLAAVQGTCGGHHLRLHELFLMLLMEVQTAIAQKTTYDLPLTWTMVDGTPTCDEADTWFDTHHDRLYRLPCTPTLPEEVQRVVQEVIDVMSPCSSRLHLRDQMPLPMALADDGDLITTSILRRNY